MTATLRADLHVHTCHSTESGNMKFLGSRDCYSRPEDVYRVAKARGMDLVAFTDHDSIGGALELLNQRPDLAAEIIVGEEVSCALPDGGLQVHLAVHGMTEALHRDVQRLRGNVFDVIARLREADVFFALNHLLHFYRGQIPLDRYLRLLDAVPALEVRNGTMAAAHNLMLEQIARRRDRSPFAVTAGSDAHSLRRVGTTWIEAPGRTRDEFLDSL
ncbi:MAG TPA: PHP domain-containing protein, partial [Vicinamibacterales bacterium]|nr:PHP domain-containing protein [Vicinamibacterales bacterium]